MKQLSVNGLTDNLINCFCSKCKTVRNQYGKTSNIVDCQIKISTNTNYEISDGISIIVISIFNINQ